MPEPESVPSTPVTEGVPAEAGSQGAVETPQGAAQSQSETPVKVDNGETPVTSSETETRSPAEWAAFRKMKGMEKQMNQMMNLLQEVAKPRPSVSVSAPQAEKVNPDDFWKDPMSVINRLLDEREQRIKGYIPEQLTQMNSQQSFMQKMQEAGKMIETNEAVKKDPHWREKFEDILQDPEYGLDEFSKVNPLAAARMALQIYQSQGKSIVAARTSPSAPRKADMGSTATGVTTGIKPNLTNEVEKMRDELMANPKLAYNKEFQEKLKSLASQTKQKAA